LRDSEKMKIDCGKKHFTKLPEVNFIGPIHSTAQLKRND
jgi:restriction endonuclease